MHLDGLIKQKAYEKPVLFLRRHPITFVSMIAVFVVLAALPYLLFRIMVPIYPWILVDAVIYPVIVLGASSYYLWIWLYLFGEFIDYYLDFWIVTNDRIVDIDQNGLFARSISELDLYRIQDVTSDVHGIIATFFNYGDVSIQTAAEKEHFLFKNVSHPHQVRQQISDLAEVDRKYHVTSALPPAV